MTLGKSGRDHVRQRRIWVLQGAGGGEGGEGGIPVFGGRDSKGQGRAKGWKRPFHTAMETAIGGLKKTTTGVTLRGWQWGGVGAEGTTEAGTRACRWELQETTKAWRGWGGADLINSPDHAPGR